MTATQLTARRIVPWYRKLNPIWALFGNEDDSTAPEGFETGRPLWQRRLLWWLRNPAHNFMWYVLGVADRERVLWSDYGNEVHKPGGGWLIAVTYVDHCPVALPFVSYLGRRVKAYVGWRPAGAFGAKLNIISTA